MDLRIEIQNSICPRRGRPKHLKVSFRKNDPIILPLLLREFTDR